VIAAVEGFALAGGLEIALACDIIVAASDARLGLPEVQRGIVAAAGGLLRLPARIPYHVAAEMILTGAPIDGTRAHVLGLVSRLVEPGAALAEAMRVAELVARNGPLAVAVSKRIMPMAAAWPTEEAWRRHDALARVALESADAREGAVAFAERRAPVWKGV
jgi:enoyl-CoA hydratase